MKAKLYLLNLLTALGVTLAIAGLPIQAQTPTDPQSRSVSTPSEKSETTWEELPPEIQAKVDPRIPQELNGEIIPAHRGGQPDKAQVAPQERKPLDKTRFLVYLKAKADLKAATARPFVTLAQQRTAVADALISTAQATQGPVKTLLDSRMAAGNVASYQPFYIFNGFAVEGNWDTVVELAKRDDVERIAANYPLVKFDKPTKASASPANGLGRLDPANWNIDLVDADRVWNEFGIRGEGAVVGDYDTGVQWDHPALKSQYRGWNGASADHNYNWFEPDSSLYPGGNLGPSVSNVPTWCDDHGVHTMGTMVGDGGTADTEIGMAPGAKWIAVPGICDNTMPGNWGDDIGGNKAFQWFLCPTDLTGNLATRDCSKAPDVVNNSWGSSNPADDTFRPAIQALRAAAIAPVFASGNPGAGPGSIGSPGAAPEAITVGATNISDTVASFSGRGPSFYEGVQKPNVTAPGVDIKSSVSGNGYQDGWSGTSMAAPAVSGLVALMVSADLKDGKRDLNVDEIQKFIESTAVKLGTTTPNDDYGYGRIDAYNAVRWVLSAGDLKGAVIDANTSAPIDGATVNGVKMPDTFTTRSASNGAYSVTVPGGLYDVSVSAFGYAPGMFSSVSVITGTNSIVNLALTPMPTAILTGTVLSGTTPINGALVYVDAKPSVSFTTGANGMYTLTLPVGTQAMSVKATGYHVQHENVIVASGGSAHNFALSPVPTILLVEADDYLGWFVGRPAHNFFQSSLDQRNYLYDTTAVTNTASLVQLTTVMTPTNYGVVIWMHTANAPSSNGYATLLQNYLNAGGRLIISGQNIGSLDGGTTFFQNYLHATYSMNAAAGLGDKVFGMGFLSGLDLTLNEAAQYNYANTAFPLSPDAVAARDGSAYPVMTYDSGNGAAALAIDPCNAPYRAVYLAVGYENLGPRAYSRPPEYADVLDRSIQWVTGSKPAYGVSTSVVPGQKILPPGSVFTYNLTIANTGVNTDTYNLALAGNAWPTRIVSGTTQVAQTVQLPACSQQILGIEVTIPGTANASATDTFTVTATSQAQPTINSSASAQTTAFPLWKIEAPMPTPRYRLGAAVLPGTPYYFAIGGQGGASWGVPMDANERYNACANSWTAMAPLPTPVGNIGAAEVGGKIYVPGGYANGTAYAVLQIYDTATNAWSTGASLPATLWGAGVAAFGGKLYTFGGELSSGTTDKTFEYDPATSTWTEKAPMPDGVRSSMAAAVLNGRIYVVGGWANLNRVEIYNPTTDTWSAAAPMNVGRQTPGLAAAPDGYLYVSGGGNGWTGLNSTERYNPATNMWTIISSLNDSNRAGSASAYVAGRVFAVGGSSGSLSNVNESLHLSDAFCMSNKQAQQATVQPGDRITYTIELRSDTTTLANARVLDPIPTGATFSSFGPATVSPAPTYNAGLNRVEWSGIVPGSQPPVTFTFGVLVNPTGWINGQDITNTATFSDGVSLTFSNTVASMLNFFDLSPSTKSVNKAQASAGVVLTYTLRIQNASTQSGSITLSDPIPANATYVPGSLTYAAGSGGYTGGVITWTTNVAPVDQNYAYGDSNGGGTVPGVIYSWVEISGTGTALGLIDDGEANVTLPFPFTFYNVASTALRVGNNGAVLFGATSGDVSTSNTAISSAPNNFIAPFWDDIDSDTGNVYYQIIGTAPNRTLVIEWYNRPHFSNVGSATFEMILYEGSNTIQFQYQDVDFGNASYNNGASATVGIRGATGQYVQYSYNSPVLTSGLAILFAPPPSQPVLSFAVTTTMPLPANTWITNTATFTDSRGVVYNPAAGTLINAVDLGTSYQIANRVEARVGEPVNYAVWLINTGQYTATNVSLSDPIPAHTTWNGVAPTCTSGLCSHASGVINWTGDITPSGAVIVSFGVSYTTPLVDRTPITNTATISDGLGGVLTRQAVFLARTPNLSAAYKTVSLAVAQPGEAVTYTVYLYNSGGGDGNAQLADPLPAGLSYVPGSLVYGSGSGGYAGGIITWTGNVPSLSQIPVEFRATLDPAATDGQVINNTAIITDVTWNTSYQRSATFTVRRIADLYMNKIGPGRAGSGATLVYTLTYGNAGPNATPGAVNVVDTLPVNATFVSASSGGVYNSTAGTVTWNVGSLASGVSGTLSLVLRADSNLLALTVLTNTATIDAIPQDANLANNTSQAFAVIGSNVNFLTSSKTVDKSSANHGGTVTYTITLVNTGNVTATVTITDPMPTGATYVLGSGTLNATSAGLYNDATNRIEWRGTVLAGGTVTLRFQVVITATGGTVVTNTVTINDGVGMTFDRQAVTRSIRYLVYLPVVLR